MKGILFKPDMIQAVVEGRKTQTRRVIKPQPKYLEGKIYSQWFWCKRKMAEVEALHLGISHAVWWDGVKSPRVMTAFAHYHAGETVYIKEAYSTHPLHYKLDGYELKDGEGTWHTPFFMPEWAARHFITILAVRTERLQGISLKDIKAEGVVRKMPLGYTYWAGGYQAVTDIHGEFAHLWNSLNPKYPWESNPWVFPYEFELLNTGSAGKHGEDS